MSDKKYFMDYKAEKEIIIQTRETDSKSSSISCSEEIRDFILDKALEISGFKFELLGINELSSNPQLITATLMDLIILGISTNYMHPIFPSIQYILKFNFQISFSCLDTIFPIKLSQNQYILLNILKHHNCPSNLPYLKIWTYTFDYLNSNYNLGLLSFCFDILDIFINDCERPLYLYNYLISTEFIYNIISKIYRSFWLNDTNKVNMLCNLVYKCYFIKNRNPKYTLFLDTFIHQIENFTQFQITPNITLLALYLHSNNEACSIIPSFHNIHYCLISDPNITLKGLYNIYIKEIENHTNYFYTPYDPDLESLLDDMVSFYPNLNNESQFYITQILKTLFTFYEDTSFYQQYNSLFNYLKDVPLDQINQCLKDSIISYCDSYHSIFSYC